MILSPSGGSGQWFQIFLVDDQLPVVLGALSSILGVLGGIVDGLHDGGVADVEGNGLDQLGHLVPELGSREKLSASDGDSQAARAIQLSFDSSPPVYSRKHIPPVRSDCVRALGASPDLPVTPM